ncbi:MAG: TonB-dependent receptor [Bacteroidales bacterium]|nr:TonB-dependent receptor [Bacteroidales bacterium]
MKLNNVSVRQAITELQRSTGYSFVYKTGDIDTGKTVSIDAGELSEAVNQILSGQDVSYVIVGKNIIVSKQAPANAGTGQQVRGTVSGRVLDSKGEPVIGAGVFVKGNQNGGVITDVDGNFSIPAQKGSVLTVSCLGYLDQDIVVTDTSVPCQVVLEEDAIMLQEAVSVGYGNLPKRSLTTAVATVKTDKLEKMPVGTLGESLYGQLPGLYIVQGDGQPGSNVSMRIRGTGSLTASSDPLFVIDGFPTNDASFFSNLSAEDIETITVLKDAASAAIYGSRAGNGVVMITTKQGQKGAPKVSFSAQGGVSQPQRYIDVLNAEEFAQMIKDARANTGMAPLPILDDPSQWTPTDWQKDVFFRTAGFQRYNVSVRGATDRVRYAISAQFQDQNGIVQNSFNKRIGITANVEIDINKHITAGVNLSPTYTYQRRQNTAGGNTTVTAGTIAEAVAYPPIYGPYMPNGDYFQIQQHTTGTNFNSELCNPLSKLMEINNDYSTVQTRAQAFLRVTPLEGLVLKTDINGSISNVKHEYYRSAYSPGSARTGNKSTPNLAAIDAYREAGFSYNWYWSSTATYTKAFGQHNLVALLGYDLAFFNNYSVRQDDRTSADYPIAYGNTNITNVNGAYIWTGSSNNAEYAFDALFGRINYDYAGRYIASASIRRDRSSKFGPDNRAGIFWSVSGAWNIAEENFAKQWPWLNVAKIRTSYGVTGNDNIGNYYVWTSTLNTSNYTFGEGTNVSAVTGYYPAGYSNRSLGWETNKQFDLGVDIGLFKKLSLTIDWYSRLSNAVLSASIPNLNGKSSTVTMNAGEIRNRGLEIAVSAPVIDRAFRWTTTFNIAFNRNKLLSLATGNDYYGSASGMVRNYVGRPLGDMYLYINDGVFVTQDDVAKYPKLFGSIGGLGDLKFKDQDGNGMINTDDMVYCGNNMPKFNAGWTNQFSYKNWDLNVVLDAQYGGLIYWGFGYASGLNRHMENAFSVYARNRWRSPSEPGDGISQKAGSSNVFLALVSQTRYLFKSDYLKLRNVSLGYNIPRQWCRSIGIDGIRLSLNAQNLFSLDEYPGYSIEASGMGGATGGSDGGNYPAVRTFTFGVNVNF